MTSVSVQIASRVAGSALSIAGLTVLGWALILLDWERSAAGSPDIQARGPFIAAAFLPLFFGAATVTLAVFAGGSAYLRRQAVVRSLRDVALAAVGLGAGVVLTRGLLLFGPVEVLGNVLGSATPAVFALFQTALGLLLVLGAPSAVEPAAAPDNAR